MRNYLKFRLSIIGNELVCFLETALLYRLLRNTSREPTGL